MKSTSRWSAVAIIAFISSSFPSARAAMAAGVDSAPGVDTRAKAEARSHFERGVQLGETGAYSAAASEFEQAYQLSPHYAVLYNLGQAHVAAGRPVDAVDVLQRYLTEGGANLQPARRVEVQATIKQQQSRISSVIIDANVVGAALLVDGVAVGRSPLPAPVRMGRGEHRISAVLDGYRATPRAITVAGDDKVRVVVTLEREVLLGDVAGAGSNSPSGGPPVSGRPAKPGPSAGAPSLAAPPATAPAPDVPSSVRRTAGYIIGAVGLAVGGGALAHYLWNKGRYDSYQHAMVNDPVRAASIRDASAVTVGLAVGAGALLATGVVLVTW